MSNIIRYVGSLLRHKSLSCTKSHKKLNRKTFEPFLLFKMWLQNINKKDIKPLITCIRCT